MGSYPFYVGLILFFLIKNIYKMIFTTSMILGTLIAISSNSWVSMWIGLEINLLSIIPLIRNIKNKIETEAAIKYFITQALASTILILAIIIILSNNNNLISTSTTSIILDIAILTKIGAAPLHFWFPEVIEGLRWINSIIILTWQKIAPITIFIYSNKSIIFTTIIIIISVTIRGIMGINQNRTRKILSYSSINHIGWMLRTTLINHSLWLIYFIIYSLTTINITIIFKNLNISFINQIINSINKNKLTKIVFSLNFLSLGGIPPFIGFIPKWITINNLIQQKMFTITLIIILITLLTLVFYIRILFSSRVIIISETKLIKNEPKNEILITFNLIILSILTICPIIISFT